jgi:hypothetical protein
MRRVTLPAPSGLLPWLRSRLVLECSPGKCGDDARMHDRRVTADRVVIGTNQGDRICIEGRGHHVIYGRGGDDVIWDAAASDVIHGGSGNDTVYANGGQDTVFGGDGADTIYDGTGDDTITGRAGNDQLVGSDGDDVVRGGEARIASTEATALTRHLRHPQFSQPGLWTTRCTPYDFVGNHTTTPTAGLQIG